MMSLQNPQNDADYSLPAFAGPSLFFYEMCALSFQNYYVSIHFCKTKGLPDSANL